MTTTPEGPHNSDDDSKMEFMRIIEANDLSELDALEARIETPNLDFIADYEAVIHALMSARHKPNKEQQEKLAAVANKSIETFKAYAADILTHNKEAAPRVIVELLTTTNNTRSEFLSEITSKEFVAFDEEMITAIKLDITEHYDTDDYEAVIGIAVETYVHNLRVDISKMLSIAIPEYSARGSTKLLEAAHTIGRHALDISKIAAGVAVGIIIADKLRK